MPPFAVYRNPGRAGQTPFVVQVQMSRLDGSANRVVIPLVAASPGAPPDQPLTPRPRIEGAALIADPPNMATVPKAHLGEPVAVLSGDDGFRIIRPMDEPISRA